MNVQKDITFVPYNFPLPFDAIHESSPPSAKRKLQDIQQKKLQELRNCHDYDKDPLFPFSFCNAKLVRFFVVYDDGEDFANNKNKKEEKVAQDKDVNRN